VGVLHTPDSDRLSEHGLFWRGTRIAYCFAPWPASVEARGSFRIFVGQDGTRICFSAIVVFNPFN